MLGASGQRYLVGRSNKRRDVLLLENREGVAYLLRIRAPVRRLTSWHCRGSRAPFDRPLDMAICSLAAGAAKPARCKACNACCRCWQQCLAFHTLHRLPEPLCLAPCMTCCKCDNPVPVMARHSCTACLVCVTRALCLSHTHYRLLVQWTLLLMAGVPGCMLSVTGTQSSMLRCLLQLVMSGSTPNVARVAAQDNMNDVSLMRRVFEDPGWEKAMKKLKQPKKPAS